MIADATDTPVSPIVVACFDAIKATTPRNDDPEHASRPFDDTRNGFVLAEGAAMFVLEEYGSATARGANIYAEVSGYASRWSATRGAIGSIEIAASVLASGFQSAMIPR